MPRGPAAEFEFRPEDPAAVLAEMDRLGAEHRGWINLQPGIRDEDAPPEPGGLTLLFAASSTQEVPVCTWVAGKASRHGVEPDSLGVQHATGPRVVARLAGLGLPLPGGWRWTQDHPRRGLVVRTPEGTTHAEQLSWLVAAGTALSKVPLTGQWLAGVYPGR
ncbi:MAG: hypothetical protein ACYDA2_02215 [Acidimicrobiales bacterium]